jgi:hypothetical protein
MPPNAEYEGTKRERTRWAKAEIWLQAAIVVQRWSTYERFDPHAPLDPLEEIAKKYNLNKDDMRRLLVSIADQLETKAMASGYDEVPQIDSPEVG